MFDCPVPILRVQGRVSKLELSLGVTKDISQILKVGFATRAGRRGLDGIVLSTGRACEAILH